MLRRSFLSGSAALGLSARAASAETRPVSLWHVFNLDTDMIYGGMKAFNASQSEFRVAPRLVPGAQIVTELIRAIATGSVPDLVTLDSPVVASFSAQGTLTDLGRQRRASKFIRPDVYFKGPWASGQWQGKTYGVPRDANTLALYYNADMFRANGLDPDKPPRTWSELRAAAGKLRDPAKNIYGFGFCATQAEEGVFQFLPSLWQAGGSVAHLDQPEATAALQFLAEMVLHGIASKDVINQGQYEVTNTFMAGNTAIVQGGPWELPRMQTQAKFEWRLAPLPLKDDKQIKADCLGGYDFVVPAGRRRSMARSDSSSTCPGRTCWTTAGRADAWRRATMSWCKTLSGHRLMRRIAMKCSMPAPAARIRNGRTSRVRCRPRSSRRLPAPRHRPTPCGRQPGRWSRS